MQPLRKADPSPQELLIKGFPTSTDPAEVPPGLTRLVAALRLVQDRVMGTVAPEGAVLRSAELLE